MVVTKIESIGSKKYKIYIDYEYAFLLYTGDIKRYKLIKGEEISEAIYYDIIEDTVFRRAKQKALAILKYMDRTEYELRIKLAQAYYTEEIIHRTIEYIASYHYIDDKRFLHNYIVLKGNSKSRRQLQEELMRKGLSKNLIADALESYNHNDTVSLKKAIKKKVKDRTDFSQKEKQKLIRYFCHKGYHYEDVIHNLP